MWELCQRDRLLLLFYYVTLSGLTYEEGTSLTEAYMYGEHKAKWAAVMLNLLECRWIYTQGAGGSIIVAIILRRYFPVLHHHPRYDSTQSCRNYHERELMRRC